MKTLGLISIFLLTAALVSAQSSLVVSKGVQHVANKKAFQEEKAQGSQFEVTSLNFPAVIVSKGIVQSNSSAVAGNIESTGYPAWTISKGVARQHVERSHEEIDSKEYPSEGIVKENREISKR